MDINTIMVNVVIGLISGGASFFMAGIWTLIKLYKKQGKDLNVAFSKIRELERINDAIWSDDQDNEYDAAKDNDQ